MKNLLKSTKSKVIAAVSGVAVTAAVVTGILLFSGEESYRTIAVEEVTGTTLVSSAVKDTVEAYEGLHLYSGDDVTVQAASDMTMVLDMDKYVYAKEHTHFWLECDGDAENSKTVIYMDDGSILNRLKDNLNEGEVYQVDTPTSTMAVRGTVFRVTVYKGEDGLTYALLEVFEGQVQVDLKTEDGEYNGVSEVFGPGEAALTRANSEFSEFVLGDDGTIKREIAYKEIPQDMAAVLVEYIDDGEVLCIGKELLMDYTELAEHKMETVEGVAATCTEDGYEEVWCVVCNEVTDTITVPATGHEFGEWEVILEPTCDNAGMRTRTCTLCGEAEEEEVQALGHEQGEYEVVVNADCTHAGEQEAHCLRCDSVVNRMQIAAIGHTAGDWQVVSNATCTANGSNQKVCTVCGEVVESGTISATGHSWGSWNTSKTATCTTAGSETRSCSTCGTSESRSTAVGGHSWSGWNTTLAATCTTAGSEARSCSVCGTSESRSTAVGGHSVTEWKPITDPQCDIDGERSGTCGICGNEVVETIPATGHILGTWEGYDGSCEVGGTERCYCTIDGCNYFEEQAFAAGHVYGSVHDNHELVINEETGEVTGLNLVWFCTRCGDIPKYEPGELIYQEQAYFCGECGENIPW